MRVLVTACCDRRGRCSPRAAEAAAERHAHGLLRPRGGARRAALRAIHRRDRHRGRGALRRQRRARGRDRRGGRQLARRRLLRPGSRVARGRRRAARGAAAGDPRPRRRRLPRRRPATGSAPRAARACSSTTPTRSPRPTCPASVFDLTDPALEGQDRDRADERLVPGVRHRDAAHGGRRAHPRRGSRA